jgi:hypothetical protein
MRLQDVGEERTATGWLAQPPAIAGLSQCRALNRLPDCMISIQRRDAGGLEICQAVDFNN